jgi:ferredoxin
MSIKSSRNENNSKIHQSFFKAETKQKLGDSKTCLKNLAIFSNSKASQYELVEFVQKLPNGQTEVRSNRCNLCGRICMNYHGMRVHRAACKKKEISISSIWHIFREESADKN